MRVLHILRSVRLLPISSASIEVRLLARRCRSHASVSSSQTVIPQIMYADSSVNEHDGDDDDDDPLIDPGLRPLFGERLDGQFDDITSSTRIFHPVL